MQLLNRRLFQTKRLLGCAELRCHAIVPLLLAHDDVGPPEVLPYPILRRVSSTSQSHAVPALLVFTAHDTRGRLVHLYERAVWCIMAGCRPPRAEKPCTRQCDASTSGACPLASQRHHLADMSRLG